MRRMPSETWASTSRNRRQQAAPKLKALLDHEQSLVRQEAAYALGNIGFAHTDLVRDAVPRLIQMLETGR